MGKLTKPMRKQRNYMRSYLESGISTSRAKKDSSGSNGNEEGERGETKTNEVGRVRPKSLESNK